MHDDIKCKFLSTICKNHCMEIYRDTAVFCLSITRTEIFQYRPLLNQSKLNHGGYFRSILSPSAIMWKKQSVIYKQQLEDSSSRKHQYYETNKTTISTMHRSYNGSPYAPYLEESVNYVVNSPLHGLSYNPYLTNLCASSVIFLNLHGFSINSRISPYMVHRNKCFASVGLA